jgi:nucleoside-triphosphatase THEP1
MIVILTGGVGSGKSAFLGRLLKILQTRSLSLDGFVGERVFENDRLSGYDLVAVRDGKRFPFLRRRGRGGIEEIGPWSSDPAGSAAAAKIIAGAHPDALLVVDELGPLELAGGGHWPALAAVLDRPQRRFLFVIRDTCLNDFMRLFAGHSVKIHSVCATMDGREIAEEIAADGRES